MNEPVAIGKRKAPTRLQRVKIFDAAGGVCHICTRPIRPGESWDADHLEPREITGSDALDGYRPAHTSCHREKTAAVDLPKITKARRVRSKHLGATKKPKMAGSRGTKWKRAYDRDTGRWVTVKREE